MGVFMHEAVAVNPGAKRVYLTEDKIDGGLYRFTPTTWPDVSAGLLEIATVASDGEVAWTEVPDPSAATWPTRQQVPGYTRFARAEGIWFDSGTVYVATTGDDRIRAYDTAAEAIELLYDRRPWTTVSLRSRASTTSRSRARATCSSARTTTAAMGSTSGSSRPTVRSRAS